MASDEEVAGIVVGIVAAGLLLLAVVVWLVRRHLRNFERHTLPAMADKLAAEPAQPAKPPASFRERWLRVENAVFKANVNMYGMYGRFISSRKKSLVPLVIGVLFIVAMYPGLTRIENANSISDLYVYLDGRIQSEKDTYEKYFGGLGRGEVYILQRKENVIARDMLRAFIDTLTPIYKKDETYMCGSDGVTNVDEALCNNTLYKKKSLYCNCDEVARSDNVISIDVTDGSGGTKKVTAIELCERPNVPVTFQASSVPSYSADTTQALGPVWQLLMNQALAAVLAGDPVLNAAVADSVTTTYINTCGNTYVQAMSTTYSATHDHAKAGFQCALQTGSDYAAAKAFGAAQLLGANVSQAGLKLTFLSTFFPGYFTTNTSDFATIQGTYNTVAPDYTADSAQAAGLVQQMLPLMLAAVSLYSEASVTAFLGQESVYIKEEKYFGHGYAEYATCIADYTYNNKAAVRAAAAGAMYFRLQSNGLTADVTAWNNMVAQVNTLIDNGLDPTTDANGLSVLILYMGVSQPYDTALANAKSQTFSTTGVTLDDPGLAAAKAAALNPSVFAGLQAQSPTAAGQVMLAYCGAAGINLTTCTGELEPQLALGALNTALQAQAAVARPVAEAAVGAGLIVTPDYVTVNNTVRALPVAWGIDRFPCSKGNIIDVFKEGDFDYPYRLKQLDQVASYVYYFRNLMPTVHAASGCENVFGDPVKRAVYFQALAGNNIPLTYTAENFAAFSAAEAAAQSNPADLAAISSAFIGASPTFVISSFPYQTVTTNNPANVPGGAATLGAIATIVATAVTSVDSLTDNLPDIVEAYFGFGYWWRDAFGDHWSATSSLSEAEILNHVSEAVKGLADYTVQDCVQKTEVACLLAWSTTKVPYETVLGDPTFDNNDNLLRAGSTRIGAFNFNTDHQSLISSLSSYLGRSLDSEERDDVARAWEAQLINYLLPKHGKSTGSKFGTGEDFEDLTLQFSAERSVADVIDEASDLESELLIGGSVALFVYVVLSVAGYHSSVYSHIALGVTGMIILLLSTFAGFGLSSYFYIDMNPLSYAVVPFIAFGIALDDMFVYIMTYSAQVKVHKSTSDVMYHTMCLAGPSVLFTSLTNIVAFFVASIVPIEIVRLFCWQMAITEILNFFSLLLIFLPIMALDCRRCLSGMADLGVRCCHNEKKVQEKDESALGRLCSKYYGPALLNPVVKVVVFVLLLAFFGCMAWRGFDDPDKGIRISELATRGSYQLGFAESIESDFGLYRAALMVESPNHQDTAVQRSILDEIDALQQVRWVVDSVQIRDIAWLPRFLGDVVGDDNVTIAPAAFYPAMRQWLKATGALLSPDLVCLESTTGEFVDCLEMISDQDNSITIVASRVFVYTKDAIEFDAFVDTIEETRDAVDPIVQKYHDENPDKTYSGFIIGYIYYYWEQNLHIEEDLYFTVGMGLVAIFAVTFLFQFSFVASFVICVCVFMTVIEVFGLMTLYDVNFNAFSLANLCISVGSGIEFSAHMSHAFLTSTGTRHDRVLKAFGEMGGPLTHGLMSSLVAVCFIAGSSVVFLRTYYFGMFLSINIVAFMNGMVFLPILLSWIGPAAKEYGKTLEAHSARSFKKQPQVHDELVLAPVTTRVDI